MRRNIVTSIKNEKHHNESSTKIKSKKMKEKKKNLF